MSGFSEFIEDIQRNVSDDQGNFSQERAVAYAIRLNKNRPGFFTPYRSAADVGLTAASVVLAPVAFALLAGVYAIAVAFATVAFIGGLAVAAATALFDEEITDFAITVAVIGGVVALVGTASALICAIGTALIGPYAVAQVAVRSGATVANLVGCLPDEELTDDSDEEILYSPVRM